MSDITRPPSTRLFVILARKAPVAVVFRRGPSKQVKLIKWDTENDTFDHGQWFKGRIHERRCDLSPNGGKLIYFATNHKRPYFSWTAVSKPPYLTALVLWPKGDAWGGGGVFETENNILLNHRENELALAEGFRLPRKMKAGLFGQHSGGGEDNPIYHTRLIRDGWKLIQEGQYKENKFGSKIWLEFDPPEIYSRAHHLNAEHAVDLRMALRGIHERDGSWYVHEYELVNQATQKRVDLGRMDWADWDKNGDLLFARQGRLYRLKPDTKENDGVVFLPQNALELTDLRNLTFEKVRAPDEALVW